MRKRLGNEIGRQRAGVEPLARRDRREERDIVPNPGDVEAVERVLQSPDRRLAVRPMGDQLGDHRIVIEADLGALEDAAVDAHPVAFRRAVADQPSDRRQEVAGRVLRVDPRLDRPALLP